MEKKLIQIDKTFEQMHVLCREAAPQQDIDTNYPILKTTMSRKLEIDPTRNKNHEIIKTTSWPATLDILAIARRLSSINYILPPCNSTEYSLSASQGVKYFSRYDHFFVEKYKISGNSNSTQKQITPTHLNNFKMHNRMICHSG